MNSIKTIVYRKKKKPGADQIYLIIRKINIKFSTRDVLYLDYIHYNPNISYHSLFFLSSEFLSHKLQRASPRIILIIFPETAISITKKN